MRIISVEISDNKFCVLHYVKAGEASTTSLAYAEKDQKELVAKFAELLKTNQVPEEAAPPRSKIRQLFKRR